jgi:hypothetical protein
MFLTAAPDDGGMRLSRRATFAAPLLLMRPAWAASRLEAGPEGFAALTAPGVRNALLLPAAGARLLPAITCGGEAVAVASFALEAGAVRMEWAVLALAQDDAMALLALEPLSWRGPGGARMATRLAASGDRRQVIFRRESAVPETPTLWRREAWTDYLAWRVPAGLADAPVRAPMAGTKQDAVAAWRRRAAVVVAAGPRVLAPALLAAAGLQVDRLDGG